MKLIFILCLVLAGCASGPSVQWIKAQDGAEATRLCNLVSQRSITREPRHVLGCQHWKPGNVCTIIAPDCAAGDTECLANIGHELKHCFDGQFHA